MFVSQFFSFIYHCFEPILGHRRKQFGTSADKTYCCASCVWSCFQFPVGIRILFARAKKTTTKKKHIFAPLPIDVNISFHLCQWHTSPTSFHTSIVLGPSHPQPHPTPPPTPYFIILFAIPSILTLLTKRGRERQI